MKILTLKSRLTNDVVERGMEIVKQKLDSISFPHDITIKETRFKFSSMPFVGASKEVASGIRVSPQEIFLEGKKHGNYDLVALVFNEVFIAPQPTNPVNDGEVMQIPSNWYGVSHTDVFVQYFLHELCHHRFWATKGVDITHDFYTSKYSQLSDGLVRWYLHLLSKMKPSKSIIEPILPPVTLVTPVPPVSSELELFLTRKHGDLKQQLGDLTVGAFSFKTMELSYKGNRRNISSIPTGRYQMKWTFSPRFMKYTYEIMNVPNRSGIRIHSANWYSQLNGCIALGTHYSDLNRDSHADIVNSSVSVNKMNAILNKRNCYITIQ